MQVYFGLNLCGTVSEVLHHTAAKSYKSNTAIKQSCSLICNSAFHGPTQAEIFKGSLPQYTPCVTAYS